MNDKREDRYDPPFPLFYRCTMNILAIDQARRGAWSVYNYENKQLIEYGTFAFDDKKTAYSEAIHYIKIIVTELIGVYDIDAVFIEDIQLRRDPQAYKKLAWLQGVLIDLFETIGITYGVVAPTQWQNYCKARSRTSAEVKEKLTTAVGKSKTASKMLSIEYVKDQFCIDTTNDNLADAVCIGWYAVNNATKPPEKKTKKKK